MTKTRAQKIWKRTIVGFSIAGAVALFLWATTIEAGSWLVLAAGSACSLWGIVEVHRMGKKAARLAPLGLVIPWMGVVAAVGFALQTGESSDYWMTLSMVTLVASATLPFAFGAVYFYWRRTQGGFPIVIAPLFLLPWLVLPLPLATLIHVHYASTGLVALLILSKLGDVAGYYVGNAIGKSHPFPGISPGKTTAGCVGSLIAGTIAGACCHWGGLTPDARFGILSGLLAGAGLNIAAQAGDLAESVLKRFAGVKDSGTAFGPSGGMLDLADSLLLSVPAFLLLWPALFETS
jgi:phosphatidate cytidylyltransferase